MIKITDIEALLNLKSYRAEINIRDVSIENIQELSRYYGSDIKDTDFYDTTTFKRGDVEITLTSNPKVIYSF